LMQKTTIYLPADLKRAIRRMARQRDCSEADVIREALRGLAAANDVPAPKLPLFRGRGASIAERIDEALATGFGKA
jgi:Arc/MetJ-type ribon-helix-helix transcriptional regulator